MDMDGLVERVLNLDSKNDLAGIGVLIQEYEMAHEGTTRYGENGLMLRGSELLNRTGIGQQRFQEAIRLAGAKKNPDSFSDALSKAASSLNNRLAEALKNDIEIDEAIHGVLSETHTRLEEFLKAKGWIVYG